MIHLFDTVNHPEYLCYGGGFGPVSASVVQREIIRILSIVIRIWRIKALLWNGTLGSLELSVCFSGDWWRLWCLLFNVGRGRAYTPHLLQEFMSRHCESNQIHRILSFFTDKIIVFTKVLLPSWFIRILFQDARKFGAQIRTALHDLIQLLSPTPREPSKTEANQAEVKKER